MNPRKGRQPKRNVQIVAGIHDVWVAWSNEDNTEGKGYFYPYVVAWTPETARRLSLGKSVQGSDCDVTREEALYYNNRWLVPAVIHEENQQDAVLREEREAYEKSMKIFSSIKEKSKEIGISPIDLEFLRVTLEQQSKRNK